MIAHVTVFKQRKKTAIASCRIMHNAFRAARTEPNQTPFSSNIFRYRKITVWWLTTKWHIITIEHTRYHPLRPPYIYIFIPLTFMIMSVHCFVCHAVSVKIQCASGANAVHDDNRRASIILFACHSTNMPIVSAGFFFAQFALSMPQIGIYMCIVSMYE